MISIITCSRDPDLAARLQENIAATVGMPFELVAVDNRDRRYGICAAYNQGADRAIYPNLCFVHEDICFVTKGWGHRLLEQLQDERVGLIGVAGGDTRGLVPSSWSIPIGSNEMHLVQHYRKEKKLAPRQLFESAAGSQALSARVAAVDGVFMATRISVFRQCRFDEHSLKGFHGYDIDYSLQVGIHYEVRVVFNILLQHYSEGYRDRQWIESAELISKKWEKHLPITVCPTAGRASINLHHWHSLRIYIDILYELGSSRKQILSGYLRYSLTRFFHIRRFLSLSKYVFFGLPRRDDYSGININ